MIDKPPFRVSETGWGEFTVQIRLQFIPESSEKPLTLAHPIKLHHWGAPIEPPPPTSVVPSAAATPAAESSQTVPAPSPAQPKVEPEESKKEGDKDGDVDMDRAGSTVSQQPSNGATTKTDTPGEGTKDDNAEGEGTVVVAPLNPIPPAPINPMGPTSIAARFPVHAWQYDEIIFSDPPLAFYNILNEHPPTPLPARNRRPRDQRELNASKKKKGRVSAIAGSTATSRAGTPATEAAGSGSVPPAASVPPAGVNVGVGIPGEPGSADVPLEFSLEMEKGEWNRLHETKKQVIEQMDKWR